MDPSMFGTPRHRQPGPKQPGADGNDPDPRPASTPFSLPNTSQDADEQATHGDHPKAKARPATDDKHKLLAENEKLQAALQEEARRGDHLLMERDEFKALAAQLQEKDDKTATLNALATTDAKSSTNYPIKSFLPHIILGVIAVVAILALAAMAYAPGTETAFIQNTLGVIAVGATTGLAGIVKGPGT